MASHGLALKHKRPKKHKDRLDKIVYFFAFAAPAFEIPQLITIYSQHSAKDVSLLTWRFFAISSFVWLVYGIRHQLKPIIVSYLLFTVVEAVTAVGIMLYK